MMENNIKSGKEVLEDFFKEENVNPLLDRDTFTAALELFYSDKLTDKSLSNALQKLRENKADDKAK